jgi:hypothetical protein
MNMSGIRSAGYRSTCASEQDRAIAHDRVMAVNAPGGARLLSVGIGSEKTMCIVAIVNEIALQSRGGDAGIPAGDISAGWSRRRKLTTQKRKLICPWSTSQMKPDASLSKDRGNYHYFRKLPTEGLAWEALRRNKAYQETYRRLIEANAIDQPLCPEDRETSGLEFRSETGPDRPGAAYPLDLSS